MFKKISINRVFYTLVLTMGVLTCYATDQDQQNPLKRVADTSLKGESQLKRRKVKEEWFNLLNPALLGDSDFEDEDSIYESEIPEKQQNSVVHLAEDFSMNVEETTDHPILDPNWIFPWIPQDVFNIILFKSLPDEQTDSILTKNSIRFLFQLTSISKAFYHNITGYVFVPKKGTLWTKKRVTSDTLINHLGIEMRLLLPEFISSSRAYILDKGREEVASNNKKISLLKDQYLNYYLKGTRVQTLPRYIIEGLNELEIPYNKLFAKEFVKKGSNRFTDFATRLKGTAIRKLVFTSPPNSIYYDTNTLLDETSRGIVEIMNNLPSQIVELDIEGILLTPAMMSALSESFKNTSLRTIHLSCSHNDIMNEEIWNKFGSGLRNSKIENISVSRTRGRIIAYHEWVKSLLDQLKERKLQSLAIEDFLDTVCDFEESMKGLHVDSFNIRNHSPINEIGQVYSFIQCLMSSSHIRECYFPRINDYSLTGLAQRLRNLDMIVDSIDKTHDHNIYFPYHSDLRSSSQYPYMDTDSSIGYRIHFMNTLHSLLPSNFILKTLDGVYHPIDQ